MEGFQHLESESCPWFADGGRKESHSEQGDIRSGSVAANAPSDTVMEYSIGVHNHQNVIFLHETAAIHIHVIWIVIGGRWAMSSIVTYMKQQAQVTECNLLEMIRVPTAKTMKGRVAMMLDTASTAKQVFSKAILTSDIGLLLFTN
jgi:hypothetical protein